MKLKPLDPDRSEAFPRLLWLKRLPDEQEIAMSRIRHFTIGAALVAMLVSAGPAGPAGSAPERQAQGSQVQGVSSMLDLPSQKSCGGGNSSLVLALAKDEPDDGSGCRPCVACPDVYPPADCGPDEKVVKKKVKCEWSDRCNDVDYQCSQKIQIETCVPKNGPKTNA